MKYRQIKKQFKKVIGYSVTDKHEVFNCVTNPEYSGSSNFRGEDMYSFEFVRTRRKHGKPLLISNKIYRVLTKRYKFEVY